MDSSINSTVHVYSGVVVTPDVDPKASDRAQWGSVRIGDADGGDLLTVICNDRDAALALSNGFAVLALKFDPWSEALSGVPWHPTDAGLQPWDRCPDCGARPEGRHTNTCGANDPPESDDEDDGAAVEHVCYVPSVITGGRFLTRCSVCAWEATADSWPTAAAAARRHLEIARIPAASEQDQSPGYDGPDGTVSGWLAGGERPGITS